jgi:hypothetical protein
MESHIASRHTLEQSAMFRAMKYLPLIAIGLLAAYEHSPGLLVVLAITLALSFAFKARVKRIDSQVQTRSWQDIPHVAGDGGSFPADQPMAHKIASGRKIVIDGGS